MKRSYSFVRAAGAPEGEKPASAEMLLYDVIGRDPWSGGGITATQVIADLETLGDAPQLDLRINSPGGEVSDGVAIYNALSRFKGRVVVHVDGIAASIATLIAMAGDEIRTAENAMWMVHQPWTVAVGDAPDMRRVADVLDKHWSSMLTTYARRTGRRAATIAQKVTDAGGEWWMTAEESVAAGFSDLSVEPSKDVTAYGLQRFRHVPERIAASADPSNAPQPVALPCAAVVELACPRRVVPETPCLDLDQIRRRRLVEAIARN